MLNKDNIVIDHIHSIRRVQFTKHLREKFKALTDGVNDLSNLTACCRNCNLRKGKKDGIWILLANYGVYFMPVVRLLVICGVVLLAYLLLFRFDDVLGFIVNLLAV